MTKRVLIMTRTDINTNPAPRRMVEWMMEEGYDVDVLCTASTITYPGLERARLISFPSCPPLGFFKKAQGFLGLCLLRQCPALTWNASISGAYEMLKGQDYDLIIAHDIYLIVLGERLAREQNAKFVFDAREFYPRQNDVDWFWRLFIKPYRVALCRDYMPKADLMLTVSPGLADAYAKQFGLPRPVVVESMARYHDRAPEVRDARAIRILHHGAVAPQRGMDRMVEMMDYLDDRYTLDLVMVESGYFQAYSRKVRAMASTRKNVRIIEPVGYSDIIPFSSQYDISLITFPTDSFNIVHSLPNKFYESIQARLAICVGESPDMAYIVQQYGLGEVATGSTAKDWAAAIARMDRAAVECYRKNAHQAAQHIHSATSGAVAKQAIRALFSSTGTQKAV